MDIQHIGHSSFRLKGKTASLITDPYDPKYTGVSFPSVSADIVTISHDHKDHNYSKSIKDVKKIIAGPGEYEINEVSIIGISSFHDEKKGDKRGKNTIYIIEMDGVRIAHLGDLGHKLTDGFIDKMGDVDILMVPVGGEYTIDAVQATELVRLIEPKIIIPMHYKVPKLKQEVFAKLASVEPFLTQISMPVEKTNKLSISTSNIGEDQKVVLFESKK